MKTIEIEANNVSIYPNGSYSVTVNLDIDNSELLSLLEREYDVKDVINSFGETELLDNIDTDVIMSYLNDLGVKTEWEQ